MAKRIEYTKKTPGASSGGNKFERLSKKSPKKQSWLKKIGFFFLYLWILSLFSVVFLKFFPVYFTPTMVSRKIDALLDGNPSKIHSQWSSYKELDKNAAIAVIASEDQAFPDHHGFDFDAMYGAVKHNMKGKKIRGASTISQQVAKNVFLWQDRSYIRKGLEVYFTFLIELIWGKERILEVYLNVAETGPMTFGVEAACRQYYGHSGAEISTSEAARIAAVLPSPNRFSIEHPSAYVRKRTSTIQRQMRGLGGVKYLDNLN
ncbi:monofunctional biosynthetic peptidoglycan transglycosylase [Aquirufa sp. A-Brett2-W8]